MPFKGFAVGAYIAGYGIVRFVLEYFREPDADLGYIIKLGDPAASIHLYSTPLDFSMGQLLCFLMTVGGLGFIAIRWRISKSQSSLLAAAEAERARIQSAKRKLKKR
jgi:phosphatidylglycerol:prolipoprotein diacylglycerol transferase